MVEGHKYWSIIEDPTQNSVVKCLAITPRRNTKNVRKFELEHKYEADSQYRTRYSVEGSSPHVHKVKFNVGWESRRTWTRIQNRLCSLCLVDANGTVWVHIIEFPPPSDPPIIRVNESSSLAIMPHPDTVFMFSCYCNKTKAEIKLCKHRKPPNHFIFIANSSMAAYINLKTDHIQN